MHDSQDTVEAPLSVLPTSEIDGDSTLKEETNRYCRELTDETSVDSFREMATEATPFLRASWAWAFLCFMTITDLDTAQLFRWATAFLSASPPDTTPAKATRKFHETTVSAWLKKIHGDGLKARKDRMTSIKNSHGLNFVIGAFPIREEQGGQLVATLLVTFEQKTQTLVHHFVASKPSHTAIWFVLHAALKQALVKVASSGDALWLLHTVQISSDRSTQHFWGEIKSILIKLQEGDEEKTFRLGKRKFGFGNSKWKVTNFTMPVVLRDLFVDDHNHKTLQSMLNTFAKRASTFHRKQKPNVLIKYKPTWAPA